MSILQFCLGSENFNNIKYYINRNSNLCCIESARPACLNKYISGAFINMRSMISIIKTYEMKTEYSLFWIGDKTNNKVRLDTISNRLTNRHQTS